MGIINKFSILIILITLSSGCVFALDFFQNYVQYENSNSIYPMNLNDFFTSLEAQEIQGQIVYDASINFSNVDLFASKFLIPSNRIANYTSYKQNLEEDFVIFIGTKNSNFVTPRLKEALGNENGLVFLEITDMPRVYVISKDVSSLNFLVQELTFYNLYFTRQGQDYYIPGAFSQQIAFFNQSIGFYSFVLSTCDPSKETDGGDNQKKSGCITTDSGTLCDTCVDSKNLIEYFCDKNFSVGKTYNCSSCASGACNTCEEKWLDKYTCVYAMFNPRGYVLQRQYQYLRGNSCIIAMKNYQKCNGKCLYNVKGYYCQNGGSLIPQTTIATRAISESSNFNIFSRIADFFRNLF